MRDLILGDDVYKARRARQLEYLRLVETIRGLRDNDPRSAAVWAAVIGLTYPSGPWPKPGAVEHDLVVLGDHVAEVLLERGLSLVQITDRGVEAFRWQRDGRDLARALEVAGNSSTPKEESSAPSGATST